MGRELAGLPVGGRTGRGAASGGPSGGRLTTGGLTVRQEHREDYLALTLTGRLDIDGVEHLAACADQICRAGVGAASFDLAGLVAVDEAGVRTLVAALHCLLAHGVEPEVVGLHGQPQQFLDELGLALPGLGSGWALPVPGLPL